MSKKPLLVNIVGATNSGVSTACHRVAVALNQQGIKTVIIQLKNRRETIRFEDDYILDKYKHVDVVLFDKHYRSLSAARRRLHEPLWDDDSVKMYISVLLTCKMQTYERRYLLTCSKDKPRWFEQNFEIWNTMSKKHFGSQHHIDIDTDGVHGLLYAAGNIKKLILQELSNGS